MSFRYRPTHMTPQHRRKSFSAAPALVVAALATTAVAGGGWFAFAYTPDWSPAQVAEITASREAACQRQVTLHLGKDASYQAQPDQVCSWLNPVPQPQRQLTPQEPPRPSFNRKAITAWVTASAKQVEKAPVNGSRNVDDQGHLVQLLQEPVDGVTVPQQDETVTQIVQALNRDTRDVDVTAELGVAKAGYEDKVVAAPPLPYSPQPGEKWVDVNLSTHTAAAYVGSDLVFGPVPVVHGHRLAPTAQGVFKIYARVPFQNMTGVGFDGPYSEPAPYIQYFHNGYALHPAPWRDSFVYTPDTGSHGCVNMQPDDAKWMWDWADTNTTVVSHQ